MHIIRIFMSNIYLLHHLQNLGKNDDFKIRRDNVKISFERRIYETVDDKSLSWDISQKST